MPSCFKKTILLLSSVLLFLPGEASARFALTGLAELEYIETQERSKDRDIEASQFQQRYEIGLSNRGYILDTRFGSYAFSIKYQHLDSNAAYDAEDLGSGSFHAANHNLLWNADIAINPRMLPFKLKIYSGDTAPLTPVAAVIPGLRSFSPPESFERRVSRVSGFSLETDDRRRWGGNGNGNGGNGNGGNGNGGNGNGGNGRRGGSVLPKIFLEYKNTYTDGSNANESYDNLNFSLSKMKNWLIYNRMSYDNLLGAGDYTEEYFQVGNVPRNGQREWFYLNNWVLLSMDLSLKRRDTDAISGVSDTYYLNLFADAFRSWWNASLYGTYYQTVDNEGRGGSSRVSLPFYISANPAPGASVNWKSSFVQSSAWSMDDPATSADEGKTTADKTEVVEDISFSRYHLTRQDLAFKSRYSLSKAMVGVGEGSNTAQRLSFFLDSGPAKSYSYGMSYVVYAVKDDDPGDDADDFMSQTLSLNGRYAYTISQRIGVTAGQTASFSEARDSAYPESRSYGTNAGVNLYIHRTLSMDIGGSRSYSENVGASHIEDIGFSGNIRFTPASWLKATSSNTYSQSKGEDLVQKIITDRSSYASDNNMEIKVNRSFSSRTKINYKVEDERSSLRKSAMLTIDEGFEYARFIQRYKARTLYSINGSVNYTESKNTVAQFSSETSSRGATLGFNHYPFRSLSWGASGNYSVSGNAAPSQSVSAYVGIPLPALNISASYSFSRSGIGEDGEADAQRFFVKVSKRF